jgi:hypothetical protein
MSIVVLRCDGAGFGCDRLSLFGWHFGSDLTKGVLPSWLVLWFIFGLRGFGDLRSCLLAVSEDPRTARISFLRSADARQLSGAWRSKNEVPVVWGA